MEVKKREWGGVRTLTDSSNYTNLTSFGPENFTHSLSSVINQVNQLVREIRLWAISFELSKKRSRGSFIKYFYMDLIIKSDIRDRGGPEEADNQKQRAEQLGRHVCTWSD